MADEELVPDDALARIEARVEARLSGRLERLEAQTRAAPAQDSISDDEEEQTFASRIYPLLASIPYANEARSMLTPYATLASEQAEQVRRHTKPCETAAAEAIAPYTQQATSFAGRLLHLSEPVLVEVESEAGKGIDIVLKTSVFSGRVVVERVADASVALGQIAAGDTILEVVGKRPKNAKHANTLISRATSLSLLVQPGQRTLGRLVGPETSDISTVARKHWRGVLAALALMWVLFTVLGAPASMAKESAYRSQIAAGHSQLVAAKNDLRVSMKRLEAATASGTSQRAEYAKLQKQHEELRQELASEKARHKLAVSQARAMSNATESLRAREKALKAKFVAAKESIEKKWRDMSTQVQQVTKDLGDTP